MDLASQLLEMQLDTERVGNVLGQTYSALAVNLSGHFSGSGRFHKGADQMGNPSPQN